MFGKLLGALIVVAALAVQSNGTAIEPKSSDNEISARVERGKPCCRPGNECCKGNWQPCCRSK